MADRWAVLLLVLFSLSACRSRELVPFDAHTAEAHDLMPVSDMTPPRVDLANADFALPSCILTAANSTIQGMTPGGEAHLFFVWMGYTGGDSAPGLNLVAAESGDVSPNTLTAPYVQISLDPLPPHTLGTQPAQALYWNGGNVTAQSTGTIDLKQYDGISDATHDVAGSLSIVGDGWNLSGSFDASYCELINIFTVN